MKDGEPMNSASIFSDRERVHYLIPVPRGKQRSGVVDRQMAAPRRELDELLKNPEKITYELDVLKQALLQAGVVATPSELCIEFINLSFIQRARGIAMNSLEKGNLTSYAFWVDVMLGMSQLGKVSLGQDYQEGTLEKIATDAVSRVGKVFDQDINHDVDGYLRIIREGKAAAALLQEDPTGFRVIDDQVGRLKKHPRAVIGRDWQIPEFVIAGAEFAQKAYKGIYPLAEERLRK